MAGKSSITAMAQANEAGDVSDKSQDFIPFAITDYFGFIDWLRRAVREDKRGAITSSLSPVLQQLSIDANEWLKMMRPNGSQFIRGIGEKRALRIYAEKIGKRSLHGLDASKRLFARYFFDFKSKSALFYTFRDIFIYILLTSDDRRHLHAIVFLY